MAGIPQRSDAMFWLNGEVLNSSGTYYFVDKSGNNRNFLITDYDFLDTLLIGFPYRTKATISAPAGDAALIAADINNFLYNSGGTPNQIPVTALFQDIDYEHKIFTRHQAMTVDELTGIMFEARVKDIVMYSSARTDDDLTKCQTFYSVPTENASAKWVSKAGNDTTGNGTKAAPYLTIEKAYKTFAAGTTVYVKTGIYTEEYNSTTLRYFYADKAGTFTIKGLGLVEMRSISNNYVARAIGSESVTNFERVIFNGESNTTLLWDSNTVATTSEVNLTKCLLKGSVTNIIKTSTNANTHYYSLAECVVLGGKSIVTVDSCSISGCYIDAFVSYAHTINYSTIRYTGAYKDFVNVMSGSTTMEFRWNNVNLKYSTLYCSVASSESTLDIEYNSITTTWTTSVGANMNIISIDNKYIIPTIEHNSFVHTGISVTDDTKLINIKSCKNPTIQYNTFSQNSKNNVFTFYADPTGTFTGVIKFNYNYIHSNTIFGIDIGIGGESTVANKWDGSEFIGNHYVGFRDTYPDETTGVSIHAVLINCSVNNIIKYNKIEKTLLGLVVKTGVQQAYTSGGIFYNIFNDCQYSIWMRGVGGINVFNNTFHHSSTVYGVPYSRCVLADENSTNLGNYCENVILRNNIYDIHTTGDETIYFDDHAAANGCVADYECINGGSEFLKNGATTYATLAEAQAAGFLANSFNTNPNLNSSFVPAVALTGVALDAAYDDGLDVTTVIPTSIVTKQQSANWQIGAFVK